MQPYTELAFKKFIERGKKGGRKAGKRGKEGRRETRKLVLSKCIGMEYMTFKFHLVYFLIKLNAKKFIELLLYDILAQLVVNNA